ncbi:hypothetical protein LXA43DRAFT_1117572 [Ganoderma leucocontextum]|nr:hypothetical protein LXA43DRAFT_1117572 [Ganoderma leucocontextum]
MERLESINPIQYHTALHDIQRIQHRASCPTQPNPEGGARSTKQNRRAPALALFYNHQPPVTSLLLSIPWPVHTASPTTITRHAMSINTQTENIWAPVSGDTQPSEHRATSIAEQITQGWRALPEEERQRLPVQPHPRPSRRPEPLPLNPAHATSPQPQTRRPVHIKLEPRAPPPDRELFLEQLPAVLSQPPDIVDDAAARCFDKREILTLADPTRLPPWRLPGAFSEGLENVPLRKPIPRDDDKEEARRYCMATEAEKHFQEFLAFLAAHRKPEADADRDERPTKERKRRAAKKWEMTWLQFRMHRRMRTSTNLPTRLHSWWW